MLLFPPCSSAETGDCQRLGCCTASIAAAVPVSAISEITLRPCLRPNSELIQKRRKGSLQPLEYLRMAVLVSHEDHGDAVRQQQRSRQVAHLALPQAQHIVLGRLALGATIPGQVVVLPISADGVTAIEPPGLIAGHILSHNGHPSHLVRNQISHFLQSNADTPARDRPYNAMRSHKIGPDNRHTRTCCPRHWPRCASC